MTCSDLILRGHLGEWEELEFGVRHRPGSSMVLRVLLLAQALLPLNRKGLALHSFPSAPGREGLLAPARASSYAETPDHSSAVSDRQLHL